MFIVELSQPSKINGNSNAYINTYYLFYKDTETIHTRKVKKSVT